MSVDEVIWINPQEIVWKITPVEGLCGFKGGDWDIERRVSFSDCIKPRSIEDHYVRNVPWAETDLFREVYQRRLDQDGRIGRCRSMADLVMEYETRIGGLFRRLERDGFATDNGKGKNYPLPSLLMGRDGDIFIGNQGNHRLALAKIIGLPVIAGKVVCLHKSLRA